MGVYNGYRKLRFRRIIAHMDACVKLPKVEVSTSSKALSSTPTTTGFNSITIDVRCSLWGSRVDFVGLVIDIMGFKVKLALLSPPLYTEGGFRFAGISSTR